MCGEVRRPREVRRQGTRLAGHVGRCGEDHVDRGDGHEDRETTWKVLEHLMVT